MCAALSCLGRTRFEPHHVVTPDGGLKKQTEACCLYMLYNVHIKQKLCKMLHLLLIMLHVYLTHPNINMARKEK